MRFTIVGAGAVGALVGAQLARAGHEVCFWVRPAQRRAAARLKIESVGGGQGPPHEVTTRFLGTGDTPPLSDWVFVCVRGEQLDDALQQIASQLGVHSNLVISAVSLDSVLERARSHGLQGRVLSHLVAFGVWRDPDDSERFLWFPFDAPSIISADAERDSLPAARTLARTLSDSGLSSRAFLSARNYTRFMMSLSAPLLAAWDLVDFELERLAADTELRRLTAAAMVEAPRGMHFTGIAKLAHCMPALFWRGVLWLLPHVIGANGREVWRHHGPKIREQTRYCLTLLLRSPVAMPALHTLAARFEQRYPSPPPRNEAQLAQA
jgi:ketopantoate reductase